MYQCKENGGHIVVISSLHRNFKNLYSKQKSLNKISLLKKTDQQGYNSISKTNIYIKFF